MGSPLRNGGAISKGGVMNGKQFAGSTYIEHAKEFSEQYQEHHQKIKQYQKHEQKYDQKHEWATESNETPLTESELEYFFWKTLVHLGWRKNLGQKLAESYQLILVCTKCDKSIVSQQSHTITLGKAKIMSDRVKVNESKRFHKSKCKPFEYDEDGNLIEAIPEAIPFEPFVEGDVRYDTIDGNLKVFIGKRWISVEEPTNTITAHPMNTSLNLSVSPEVQDLLAKNMNNYLDKK